MGSHIVVTPVSTLASCEGEIPTAIFHPNESATPFDGLGDAARNPSGWRSESMDPRASAHCATLDLGSRLHLPCYRARNGRVGRGACRRCDPFSLGRSRGGLVSSARCEKPALTSRQSP